MTLFGKLFVLMNLGLSLMMAAAALALWGTGIDWQKTPPKGDRPAGRLYVLEQQLDRLRYARGPIETSWADAWADAVPRRSDDKGKLIALAADDRGLMFLDERRRERRRFYAAELEFLREKATDAAPGKSVVLTGGLPVVLDPAGFGLPNLKADVDRSGKALLSLKHYANELTEARNENRRIIGDWVKVDKTFTPKKVGAKEERGTLNKAIANHTKETEKITGTKDDSGKVVKGLRHRLNDDREQREGIEEEINRIGSLQVNVGVESELVELRYNAMQERIKELKAYLRRHHKEEWDDKGG